MERLNLKKFGFERNKEDDFSDDGNRFLMYHHPEMPHMRFSKLVKDGCLYLAARREPSLLNYSEYSNLPKYKSLDSLNVGEYLCNISEEELEEFVADCKEYAKAYEDKVAELDGTAPTDEQLRVKYNEWKQQLDLDYIEVLDLYNGVMFECFQSPYVSLDSNYGTYCFRNAVKYIKDAICNITTARNKSFEDKLQELNSVKYTSPRLAKESYLNEVVKRNWYLKEAADYFKEVKATIKQKKEEKENK